MLSNKRVGLFGLMVMILLVLSPVSAQGVGGRNPSGQGGNAGGPGMSGMAVNAGSPVERDRPGGGVGNGGGPGNGVGGGPGAGGDANPNSGFAGGFNAGGGLSERFGDRGTGAISLDSFLRGDGQSWLGAGGFGARTQGGFANLPIPIEGTPWRPVNFSGNWEPVPGALADPTALISAQQQAQAAVEAALSEGGNAVENASQQAQDAVVQASASAQAAYDQFWTDYYSAVDYAANSYYAAVSASADYALQTYQEAVTYTTTTIDYYVDYYAQYAAYCSAYPWDCYSYTYDAATNTYNYIGDTSDSPVGTTTIGNVAASVGYPSGSTSTPSVEAYESLVLFANDQLGAVIEPLYAGNATDYMQTLMSVLPDEMEAYLLNSTTMSAATYWGLLNGGGAVVSVGDCGSGNCTISSESLSATLSSASAGVYGLFANGIVPTTSDIALQLITQVYPKLEGLGFSQVTDVEQGLAFTATTASLGIDPVSQQPISVVKVIYAGVVDMQGQPFVYAMVAVGEAHASVFTNGS